MGCLQSRPAGPAAEQNAAIPVAAAEQTLPLPRRGTASLSLDLDNATGMAHASLPGRKSAQLDSYMGTLRSVRDLQMFDHNSHVDTENVIARDSHSAAGASRSRVVSGLRGLGQPSRTSFQLDLQPSHVSHAAAAAVGSGPSGMGYSRPSAPSDSAANMTSMAALASGAAAAATSAKIYSPGAGAATTAIHVAGNGRTGTDAEERDRHSAGHGADEFDRQPASGYGFMADDLVDGGDGGASGSGAVADDSDNADGEVDAPAPRAFYPQGHMSNAADVAAALPAQPPLPPRCFVPLPPPVRFAVGAGAGHTAAATAAAAAAAATAAAGVYNTGGSETPGGDTPGGGGGGGGAAGFTRRATLVRGLTRDSFVLYATGGGTVASGGYMMRTTVGREEQLQAQTSWPPFQMGNPLQVQVGDLLGRGGCGSVWSGTWRGRPVAIKVVQQVVLVPAGAAAAAAAAAAGVGVHGQGSTVPRTTGVVIGGGGGPMPRPSLEGRGGGGGGGREAASGLGGTQPAIVSGTLLPAVPNLPPFIDYFASGTNAVFTAVSSSGLHAGASSGSNGAFDGKSPKYGQPLLAHQLSAVVEGEPGSPDSGDTDEDGGGRQGALRPPHLADAHASVKRLRHPNVLRTYAYASVSTAPQLGGVLPARHEHHVLLELCEAGSLRSWLDVKLRASEAAERTRQAAEMQQHRGQAQAAQQGQQQGQGWQQAAPPHMGQVQPGANVAHWQAGAAAATAGGLPPAEPSVASIVGMQAGAGHTPLPAAAASPPAAPAPAAGQGASAVSSGTVDVAAAAAAAVAALSRAHVHILTGIAPPPPASGTLPHLAFSRAASTAALSRTNTSNALTTVSPPLPLPHGKPLADLLRAVLLPGRSASTAEAGRSGAGAAGRSMFSGPAGSALGAAAGSGVGSSLVPGDGEEHICVNAPPVRFASQQEEAMRIAAAAEASKVVIWPAAAGPGSDTDTVTPFTPSAAATAAAAAAAAAAADPATSTALVAGPATAAALAGAVSPGTPCMSQEGSVAACGGSSTIAQVSGLTVATAAAAAAGAAAAGRHHHQHHPHHAAAPRGVAASDSFATTGACGSVGTGMATDGVLAHDSALFRELSALLANATATATTSNLASVGGGAGGSSTTGGGGAGGSSTANGGAGRKLERQMQRQTSEASTTADNTTDNTAGTAAAAPEGASPSLRSPDPSTTEAARMAANSSTLATGSSDMPAGSSTLAPPATVTPGTSSTLLPGRVTQQSRLSARRMREQLAAAWATDDSMTGGSSNYGPGGYDGAGSRLPVVDELPSDRLTAVESRGSGRVSAAALAAGSCGLHRGPGSWAPTPPDLPADLQALLPQEQQSAAALLATVTTLIQDHHHLYHNHQPQHYHQELAPAAGQQHPQHLSQQLSTEGLEMAAPSHLPASGGTDGGTNTPRVLPASLPTVAAWVASSEANASAAAGPPSGGAGGGGTGGGGTTASPKQPTPLAVVAKEAAQASMAVESGHGVPGAKRAAASLPLPRVRPETAMVLASFAAPFTTATSCALELADQPPTKPPAVSELGAAFATAYTDDRAAKSPHHHHHGLGHQHSGRQGRRRGSHGQNQQLLSQPHPQAQPRRQRSAVNSGAGGGAGADTDTGLEQEDRGPSAVGSGAGGGTASRVGSGPGGGAASRVGSGPGGGAASTMGSGPGGGGTASRMGSGPGGAMVGHLSMTPSDFGGGTSKYSHGPGLLAAAGDALAATQQHFVILDDMDDDDTSYGAGTPAGCGDASYSNRGLLDGPFDSSSALNAAAAAFAAKAAGFRQQAMANGGAGGSRLAGGGSGGGDGSTGRLRRVGTLYGDMMRGPLKMLEEGSAEGRMSSSIDPGTSTNTGTGMGHGTGSWMAPWAAGFSRRSSSRTHGGLQLPSVPALSPGAGALDMMTTLSPAGTEKLHAIVTAGAPVGAAGGPAASPASALTEVAAAQSARGSSTTAGATADTSARLDLPRPAAPAAAPAGTQASSKLQPPTQPAAENTVAKMEPFGLVTKALGRRARGMVASILKAANEAAADGAISSPFSPAAAGILAWESTAAGGAAAAGAPSGAGGLASGAGGGVNVPQAGSNYAPMQLEQLRHLCEVLECLAEVASGLAYLHAVGMVHGDIKSGNVLLKRDPRTARGFVLKLADFGFSRVLEHGSHTYLSRPSGTLAYLSPELLTSHRQSSAADVYAFGLLVWETVTTQPLFRGLATAQLLYAKTHHQDWLHLKWPDWAPFEVRCLARRCTEYAPAARVTAVQALAAIEDMRQRFSQDLLALEQPQQQQQQ